MKPFPYLIFLTAIFTALAHGQVFLQDNLSSSNNWIIVDDEDSIAQFGYDYSVDGIPPAPSGSGDTIGLKMEANISDPGLASEIAVVHELSFSGSVFRVTFDMWTNYSFSEGGSTEFSGCSVGHDGVTAGRDGAVLIMTGDGGSSRDFRLYKDKAEQFISSLMYGPSLTSNNGSDATLSATFTGSAAPATQGQVGTSDPGDTAFEWIQVQIDVDPNAIGVGTTSDPGLATFTLTSTNSGKSVVIGTMDNSNGGPVVNMDGSIALIHSDLFSSLASRAHMFSIFDNVVVSSPNEIVSMEPDGNGSVTVNWMSLPGESYEVEATTNLLTGSFDPVGFTTATGSVTSLDVAVPHAAAALRVIPD